MIRYCLHVGGGCFWMHLYGGAIIRCLWHWRIWWHINWLQWPWNNKLLQGGELHPVLLCCVYGVCSLGVRWLCISFHCTPPTLEVVAHWKRFIWISQCHCFLLVSAPSILLWDLLLQPVKCVLMLLSMLLWYLWGHWWWDQLGWWQVELFICGWKMHCLKILLLDFLWTLWLW